MRGLRMRTAKRRKVEREGRAKSNRDVGSNATVAPLPRRGIQSVNIGFRVLAALAAEAGAAGLGTVAQRSNLSPSQAHRYLASLVASGMAHQDPSSGRYELGPQAIQIGLAALSRTDVFAEADPAIAAFTRETGRTTLIAARGPLGPTVVRWHAARMPVITSVTVGSVLSFLTSATGHVFLSFMNAEEAAGAIEIERGTVPRAVDIDLNAIRSRVRGAMAAFADETVIPGLRAAAVPILDIQGRAALVVTVLVTSAVDRSDDKQILERLQAVCGQLTKKIGGRWL
jgi:DNA-binding IclR family transcriptional regulator